MSVRQSYHEAGDVESFDSVRSQMLKKDTAIEITKGKLLSLDIGNARYQIASTGDPRPFFIARRTSPIGSDQVEAVGQDFSWYAQTGTTTDGVIVPYTYVKAFNGGLVTQWVQGTDDEDLKVGLYVRHGDNPTLHPVQTVAGAIILIEGGS